MSIARDVLAFILNIVHQSSTKSPSSSSCTEKSFTKMFRRRMTSSTVSTMSITKISLLSLRGRKKILYGRYVDVMKNTENTRQCQIAKN